MIKQTRINSTRERPGIWERIVLSCAILAMVFTGQSSIAVPAALAMPAAAPTSHLDVNVVDASNNSIQITQFKYIINEDNTGTTEQRSPADGCSPASPGYPGSCNWVSAGIKDGSFSPIYAEGDQNDFITGLDNLPDGRYLISVIADGYKLDGTHFTMPISGPVTVQLQPTPLPDATIRARVFEDNAPTNSAPDEPAERGLAGFVGHLTDYIDFVTTDVYGNPLCTTYVGEDPVTHVIPAGALDADQLPVVDVIGGQCVSDANGDLVIPHLGPNRYALSAVPPDGSDWIQTTTLEGNHDWDSWVMEGATGFDTEFAVAGEPYPAVYFGFVHGSLNTMAPGSGDIKGIVMAVDAYTPPVGGGAGQPGLLGGKDDHPINGPWLSLSDLSNGDTAVYVTKGNADGTFNIPNVPDGDYFLGVWDEPQDYIFNFMNVSVRNGETVDMGSIPLTGWWATLDGYVFVDTNGNGKMDAGEQGVPNFPVSVKKRENSLMDRGTVSVTTDQTGYYFMESLYPMTQFLVIEAYADLYQTTGVTYQADNQPTPTTVLGSGVDVNMLPIIGLGGRLDWGVKPYDPGTNGGIVGTVTYDTTRNELDPRFSATENWQPGVPNLNVDLYAPVDCGTTAAPCDALGMYELAPDGSYAKGQLLNQYLTETWEQPSGCVARDVNGNPLQHGIDEDVLPLDPNAACLEGPLMSTQFGPMSDGTNFGASVDGNYGFGDGCFGPGGFDPNTQACADGSQPTSLTPADYLVQVEIPNDALGRPMYKFTSEEDINIFHGDQYIPQIPPPACAGPLHTVDVAGVGTDGYPADGTTFPGITVPASTPVVNSDFADGGGSPYEGSAKPSCDTKLIRVSNGRSIAPNFNIFTDVPLPARFWGLLVDDLNFSSDPKSLLFGEKMGIPFAPVGIYDYTNRLVATVESDYNGLFDVLLPSTNRISCPTPSGVCANLYRFVGNDPGIPGRWNPNYNPQYRTIAAEFEAFAGLLVPADLAPTQVAVNVQVPGTQTLLPIACTVDAATPQFFAITKPYMDINDSARSFTLTGLDFGATAGSVTLDDTPMTIDSWTDPQIQFTIPVLDPSFAGPHQLKITGANGKSAINSLTFHILGGTYTPIVKEVGPGYPYSTIQSALDSAATDGPSLVVVYPAPPDNSNPRYNGRGAYYENLIMYSAVKLQGVGPGGVYSDGTPVYGSIIDGIAFGGDTALADAWRAKIASLTWDGNQNISEGEVIYILAHDGQFTADYKASIDGLDLRGGDQMGFPGNVTAIFGGYPGPTPVINVETQGGAIFANAYARYLQITNNTIQNNGGAYGTIRIGTPNLAAPNTDNQNDNLRIANNRIIANGGTNLAGAIGLFNGADNYEIANNDICGNFSAEYGGGISVFGLQKNQVDPVTNSIHDNRIYFNRSYDEGAGIMIAGELPADPFADYGTPTGAQGSGPVDIYNNLIQSNLSDDDGGGLRFLMAGNFPMNVYNNMIANNVSTHEGGGVAMDDAPDVRFYNNTVMKNITTATAITSDGTPAPAGLSTGQNSQQLQNTLPGGSPTWSDPLLFNNIFWDNRAGSRGVNMVTGIGAAGDLTPINNWDMGLFDNPNLLSPTNTILQTTTGTNASPTSLVGSDPTIITPYDVALTFTSWRTNINYIGAIMVSADLPPSLMGDYHIQSTSPAVDQGAVSKNSVTAPPFDIDNQVRPASVGFDMGADEISSTAYQANLAVAITDATSTTGQGTTNSYSIVVSNSGPNTVNGAAVAVTLPATLTPVGNWTCAASGVGSNCSAATGTGNINTTVDVAVGGSVTFTTDALVSAGAVGSVTAIVDVTMPSGWTDPDLSDNSVADTDTIPLVTQANLAIAMTDATPTTGQGTTNSYTIFISNSGPSTVSGATVAVTLPATLTPVGNWTCAASGAGSNCSAATGTGSINTTVDVAVGGSVTFAMNATVSATAVGPVTASVNVTLPSGWTDPDLSNNNAADTDTIPTTDLRVTKLTDNKRSVAPGSTITYLINVSNAGPDTVTGATVTDNLPANLTTLTWTCAASAGSSCTTGGSGNQRNGSVNLIVNGSAAFTATGTLSSNASGVLINTATVTPPAGTPDLQVDDNSATDTTFILPVLHVADLDATSSNQDGSSWGATVTVTIHNAANKVVRSATVRGNWSAGGSGAVACVTNFAGQCTFSRDGFSKPTDGTVAFTVSSVQGLMGATYQPALNQDPDGNSNGTTIEVAMPIPTAAITAITAAMHVANLDQASVITGRRQWRAVATITVLTTDNNPVAGVIVTGKWSAGGGTFTCTTNAAGQCNVSRSGLRRSISKVTFTVIDVTDPSQTITYLPSANQDPDTASQNSNGTTITVKRP